MTDLVAAQLAAVEESLRTQLAGHATIMRTAIGKDISRWVGWDVRLAPFDATALEVGWAEFPGHEIVLWAGHGGRWELNWATEDVAFLENVVSAVTAGNVREIFALNRSLIEVTLSDGTTRRSGVGEGLFALVPLPGWTRWGRKVCYSPYVQSQG